MSCCPAARRRAIAEIQKNLTGQDGWALMEYRGGRELVVLQSRTTEAIYVFSPGMMKYVDVFDLGMFADELEEDEQVFFKVGQ